MSIEIPASLRERFEKQARELYGEQGEATALAQAIELWLAEARVDAGHRLVVRIGDEPPPKTRRLGWRHPIHRNPSARIRPTDLPSGSNS
ncbi:MAG TPA: hypothetical protein VJ793_15500 [Anaerolineae bacterium]|nr:hypothetical protein [Anaerolineae bacterium]